jgi:serine/threonine protein kinase/tetratricopeptide (TPR) repeat protein
MSPPNREVAIFSAALELDPSQRAAYLEKACADDPALRRHIEALLADYDKALNFLEAAPPGVQAVPSAAQGPASVVTSSLAEKEGSRIGRYKLLQQIGEGGCGVVYMAEQEEPVRRRVALKVIKLGMDTKQVIARFEAERQALALMDHPNIAKVLDAGATETGRPYFVMELVRGIKITTFCDENNLSTEERLQLFTQVCHAIQHAHQKGVIHRDIKPSNILVADHDGVPVPKVIDFGVAKATSDQRLTDKTLFTAFEQFVGTPAYMSPEQAKLSGLDIDTRTDIYSLGVLLYELLTGKTPLDQKELLAAGLDEMRRTIREKEPPRPSTRLSTMLGDELTTTAKHRRIDPPKLIHLLRGDLDWIVMKALEKDRARRYETANGLAMDIQRHLDCEPVVARPPSRLYEFQKTVRRHKFGFTAAAALIVVLALGVVASTWQALRASSAERRAQTEAQRSSQVAELMKKMLRSVGPSVARGRDRKMMLEILDETAKGLEHDLTNQPEVIVDVSMTVAGTYYDMGLWDQAVEVSRRSLRLARKLGRENESVARSLISLATSLLAIAQQHLGMMYAGSVPEAEKTHRLQDRDLVEADQSCQEGLAMSRELLGNENLRVARALNVLAQIRQTQYRLAEAESLQRESLNMYRRLNDEPSVARLTSQLAYMFAFREDRLADAENLSREALAIQKKLLGGDDIAIARSLFKLADLLRRQGKYADAETQYRDGLAMWRRMGGGEGFEVASALGFLSEVLTSQGKLEDAETQRRDELELFKKLNGNEGPAVAVAGAYLADLLQRRGKLDEAATQAREVLVLSRKLASSGGAREAVLGPIGVLVGILLEQHKEVEAERVLGDSLRLAPPGQQTAGVLSVRSAFFARTRRWPEAIADLTKAIELDETDDEAPLMSAVLLLETGDITNYRVRCQKMMASFRDSGEPNTLAQTAEACLLGAGEESCSEAARQLAEQAFKLGKDSYLKHYYEFVKGLAEYRAGRFASAIEWVGKSAGQQNLTAGRKTDAEAYLIQAMAQHQLKRAEESRAALAKGEEMVNSKLLKLENATLDEYWFDWLVAHILLREAQALIEGAPQGKESNP